MRGLTVAILGPLALAGCAREPACDGGVDQANRAIDLARIADMVRQYPTVQGALNGGRRVLQEADRPAPGCPRSRP